MNRHDGRGRTSRAVTRVENVDAPLTAEGTRLLPGAQGGTNWYGPSCSPRLNLLCGIVTYMRGGTQYVAVAGGMKNPVIQTDSGPAWVAIFTFLDRARQ